MSASYGTHCDHVFVDDQGNVKLPIVVTQAAPRTSHAMMTRGFKYVCQRCRKILDLRTMPPPPHEPADYRNANLLSWEPGYMSGSVPMGDEHD